MARKVRNGRLVEACSCVYVDGIDRFVGIFRPIDCRRLRYLILPRGCKEKTSVRREGESPEEGRESFIGVDVGVADPRPTMDLR